jgi:hypothetical protein
MKRMTALFLLLAASCATADRRGDAIALLGSPSEQHQFAGNWTGAIRFDADHRSLDSAADFSITPGTGVEDGRLTPSAGNQPPFLYARVSGSKLIAATAPHYDRACTCTVSLTTEGVLRGDVITGEVHRVEDRKRIVVGTFAFSRSH